MPTARVTLDPRFVVGPINRRLFGSFIEHMGRAVYTGIYEPGHPTADEDGFRQDVLMLVKELGVTGIRYPGGNFVSGFHWRDGIGPKDQRPRRLSLAWRATETNQVGLHEFASWVEKVGGELMYAVNLGTADTRDSLEVLEYANIRKGSTLAEERIANGRAKPFGIKMWYLGNEMDGPWQLGHSPADDYAKKASRTAKALRQLDPQVELVASGSSHPTMPTFPYWDRVVLEHTYDDVDYISCHGYYEEKNGDLGSFLASPVKMDRYLDTVIATADYVKAAKRSEKTLNISFDEWNVWYLGDNLRQFPRQADRFYRTDEIEGNDWPEAPRLAEDVYSVADAVVVGGLLISLLRHADRVTSASMSMLVNVIAPITTEPGGPAWRQTTYYPFAVTSRLAVGVALDIRVETDQYHTDELGVVPLVDAVATHDADSGRAAVFLVNRSLTDAVTVTVDLAALGDLSLLETHMMSDPDVYARNTKDAPDRVTLKPNPTAKLAQNILAVTLPPVSWTAVALGKPTA
ncbi:alpha-N-arabinofuranosidase [Pseudarthrobacter sp. NamB4]|uniref:arabinosylfuranosidase ArfA n=1 Tax=Pseudarthrobacter sp. NamB4 TaxID=2576837 RepID=UPI0010FE0684|nr:alpha-N-arabinofuranosidase [Pseudarthrobacter sp. NamB4]TLM72230.1 alpha-N-arabinofuranosidase [Pseudarthrobacter sp. NamB4]